MPHDDYESALSPDEDGRLNGLEPDAEPYEDLVSEGALDAFDGSEESDGAYELADPSPRERSRSTAMPLNLGRPRASIFPTSSNHPTDSDDSYDAVDEAGDDSDGLPADTVWAAPATQHVEAVGLTTQPTALTPATIMETSAAPTVIPGAKRLRRPPKNPFIARRSRPLMIGMLATTIIAALVISGLVIATPLAGVLGAGNGNPLVASSGAVQAAGGVRFTWYTARWGDTPQTLAQDFRVALGGIYELNNLSAGDELLVGRQYMIPADPTYGETYTPPAMLDVSAHYGNIRYGPNWWDSIAGTPPASSPCAPNGGANELAYHLQPPNWGARWVRGYIVYGTWVYHTGVDLAAPQGNVIHAAQAGQVIWAGYDATNGLGWSVKIDHCNHVSTVYGHMMRVLVNVGDYVDEGAPVGLEGSTGNSTGPHLHFMVEWNNLWVDPMLFYASQAAIIGPPPQ